MVAQIEALVLILIWTGIVFVVGFGLGQMYHDYMRS